MYLEEDNQHAIKVKPEKPWKYNRDVEIACTKKN